MSGSLMLTRPPMGSYRRRIRLLGIDVVLLDGGGDARHGDLFLVGQALQRRERDVVAIDLEEMAQACAIVAAAETVRAQHPVAARDKGADLISKGADIIARGDNGPRMVGQARLDMAAALLGGRMQHVPALHLDTFAAELGE